ncbi:MAG TPA: hypothetical protein VNN22_18390 [Verrucomicrobiae bacterium]|nr:hypothetical protein [Verrucomicrobiae bacterium]
MKTMNAAKISWGERWFEACDVQIEKMPILDLESTFPNRVAFDFRCQCKFTPYAGRRRAFKRMLFACGVPFRFSQPQSRKQTLRRRRLQARRLQDQTRARRTAMAAFLN